MLKEELPSTQPSPARTADQVAAFTRLFSTLVDSGKPLGATLDELAAQEGDTAFCAVIQELSRDIRRGDLPSRIMARHPHYFPEAYIAIIREGENSGELEVALQKLVEENPTPA